MLLFYQTQSINGCAELFVVLSLYFNLAVKYFYGLVLVLWELGSKILPGLASGYKLVL